MWKRRKDLLYLGSVHGGDVAEFFGITDDYVGTDALGMCTLLPPTTSAANEDRASQLHQLPRPQPPHQFDSYQLPVEYNLAQIHPRHQDDALVQ